MFLLIFRIFLCNGPFFPLYGLRMIEKITYVKNDITLTVLTDQYNYGILLETSTLKLLSEEIKSNMSFLKCTIV